MDENKDKNVNSDDTANGEEPLKEERVYTSKYKFWIKSKLARFHDHVAFINLSVVALMFSLVIAKTGMSPGLLYCNKSGLCPSIPGFGVITDPNMPHVKYIDFVSLLIVGILSTISILFAILILIMPSGISFFPLRPKIISIMVIFLILVSLLLVIMPFMYRASVFPMSMVQDSEISLEAIASHSGIIRVKNMYNTAMDLYLNSSKTVTAVGSVYSVIGSSGVVNSLFSSQITSAKYPLSIQVFQSDEPLQTPESITPLTELLASDNVLSLDSLSEYLATRDRVVGVENLKENSYVSVLVGPGIVHNPTATRATLRPMEFPLVFFPTAYSPEMNFEQVVNDLLYSQKRKEGGFYIDLRFMFCCKWSSSGCTDETFTY